MGSWGHYDRYGKPYFVEVSESGHYRYVWDNKQSNWNTKPDEVMNNYTKNGIWLEVLELPEKPWKWPKLEE